MVVSADTTAQIRQAVLALEQARYSLPFRQNGPPPPAPIHEDPMPASEMVKQLHAQAIREAQEEPKREVVDWGEVEYR